MSILPCLVYLLVILHAHGQANSCGGTLFASNWLPAMRLGHDIFAGTKPCDSKPCSQLCVGEHVSVPIEIRINQGMLVAGYIDQITNEPSGRDKFYKTPCRFPNGFWKGFFRSYLHIPWSIETKAAYVPAQFPRCPE